MLTCVSLLTAALAEQSAVMSITAACLAPVLHRLDIGVGELTRPCDCYASFQETVVPRLICHVHSGAPPAVHPNHTCGVLLMLLLVLDSMPGNRTTLEAVDWMVVLLQGVLSNTGKSISKMPQVWFGWTASGAPLCMWLVSLGTITLLKAL